MEKTLLASSTLQPLSFPPRISRKMRNAPMKTPRTYKAFARRKESCDWDYGGRLVDESMIVLRKRIHEMKVVERNYEPPEDWTQWEKQYYASYDEFICKLVGLLQARLINTRPCLALGVILLISMSLPTSMGIILSELIQLSNTALQAAFHT